MLWNVFPFHPHEADAPLSNRCHTRSERVATWALLQSLIEMLRPRQIVAIGRDAQMALGELSIPTRAARHPSYGGQNEFMATMHALYGIDEMLTKCEPKLPLEIRHATNNNFAFA
ncbi:uracil-DNA glycosylase family protein [Sphingomonas paeninsulae]